jgi:hypothetical protein
MTPDHCDLQIVRLSVLRGIPDDICEYFSALKDVPDERFTLAVSHALKTRAWFPSPAELRADVDATAPQISAVQADPKMEPLIGGGYEMVLKNPFNGAELRIKVSRVWKFDCEDCSDSGWRSNQCPSDPCGRRYLHDAHEWVQRCHCVDWNPTIRRRKEALGIKYAKAPEKVGG